MFWLGTRPLPKMLLRMIPILAVFTFPSPLNGFIHYAYILIMHFKEQPPYQTIRNIAPSMKTSKTKVLQMPSAIEVDLGPGGEVELGNFFEM